MKKIYIVSLTIILMIVAGCLNLGQTESEQIRSIDDSLRVVNEKWIHVENQYQKRVYLIPNLIDIIKIYATYDDEVFKYATRSRSQWVMARTPYEKMKAAQEIDSALLKLMLIVESYPQLKANKDFIALRIQLEDTENVIAATRMDYNIAVKEYNTKIKTIPRDLVARYGYEEKPFFESVRSSGSPEVIYIISN